MLNESHLRHSYWYELKVHKFQNENMTSSHCQKYERKNLKNSALSIQSIFFQIFRSYFGQWDDSRFLFWNFLTFRCTYRCTHDLSFYDCKERVRLLPDWFTLWSKLSVWPVSNEKEQIDAKRVHPNVHKIYSLGLYLCTDRYIQDKSWKQHRWHLQSFHHCYRIGSHCSSSFPFTRMKSTKY